jgi:hypothetical protein
VERRVSAKRLDCGGARADSSGATIVIGGEREISLLASLISGVFLMITQVFT